MEKRNSILHRFKPGIPKRALLFLAGGVWTFAGVMLLLRGGMMLFDDTNRLAVKLIACTIAGGFFYYFLFDKISAKHTNRIKNLPYNYPCAFSFFNWKGYLMMGLMITMGITLRTTAVISPKYLALMYITMGIPLFISAVRFYVNGINYHNIDI